MVSQIENTPIFNVGGGLESIEYMNGLFPILTVAVGNNVSRIHLTLTTIQDVDLAIFSVLPRLRSLLIKGCSRLVNFRIDSLSLQVLYLGKLTGLVDIVLNTPVLNIFHFDTSMESGYIPVVCNSNVDFKAHLSISGMDVSLEHMNSLIGFLNSIYTKLRFSHKCKLVLRNINYLANKMGVDFQVKASELEQQIWRLSCGVKFANARKLSAEDLRDPEISSLIASKMKEFHSCNKPGKKTARLWDSLRTWLSRAKSLCSKTDVDDFGLDRLHVEIQQIEKELVLVDQQIGYCQNDHYYGNIIMVEETKSITLVDCEFSSYNPVAYDLANHFCEMAANYHSDAPLTLDYSKYPDQEERRRFINAYLNSPGEKPSDSEVDNFLQLVEKYSLANHLFWGLWGIVSACMNKNVDIPYIEYARQRFHQYWQVKRRLPGPSLTLTLLDDVDAETGSVDL